MFDIIIVSYNNLQFLQLTIDSINKNSVFLNNIIVHVNEGTDGTIEWLDQQNIQYTHTSYNAGLSVAANIASSKAFNRFICLIDDDMYLCPDWDSNLYEFRIQNNLNDSAWVCSTVIEREGGCSGSVQGSFGGRDTFLEQQLLNVYKFYNVVPRVSTQVTPLTIGLDTWKTIGGYDQAFFVIGSEEGLAKRLYDRGTRNFVNAPDSLAYHFATTTTNKLMYRTIHSEARDKIFKHQHNMTIKEFNKLIGRGNPWKNHS